MTKKIAKRCVKVGKYYVEHASTNRETAKHFRLAKTTVWEDLAKRLPLVNDELYQKVCAHAEENKKRR